MTTSPPTPSSDEPHTVVARAREVLKGFAGDPRWPLVLFLPLFVVAAVFLFWLSKSEPSMTIDGRPPAASQPSNEEPDAQPDGTLAPTRTPSSTIAPPFTLPSDSTTTTTTVPAPTTTKPAKRAIEIRSNYQSCKYGSRCLAVGFTLTGFDPLPNTFICEFSSGNRYDFKLTGAEVDTACFTADKGDTITIEVDGVRSETVKYE